MVENTPAPADLVEAVARALAFTAGVSIVSDASYRHSAYGTPAQAAIAAMRAYWASEGIVQADQICVNEILGAADIVAHDHLYEELCLIVANIRRAAAVGRGDGYQSLELCVQFSECGQHICKWSRLPFDGGTDFYSCLATPQLDPRDAVVKELQEALDDLLMRFDGWTPHDRDAVQRARTARANSEGK